MKFFMKEEMRDLIISMLAVAMMFAFPDFQGLFIMYLAIVVFTFFFRVMGHKFLANRLGCMATYKMWPVGILLGLTSMFLKIIGGFVFVAPGFMEIMPYKFGRWGIKVIRLTPRDIGKISLAGVGINILFAIFFKFFPREIFQMLSSVNGYVALFSLLPIPPLDGVKILTWNMAIWAFLVIITILSLVI